MNTEKICYGCFGETENGVCAQCGFCAADYVLPATALPLGTILAGRYLTGKVLGVGGFGVTYLGYDLTLEIRVAIKEYMPASVAVRGTDRYTMTVSGEKNKAGFDAGMDRFLAEARILAKLQSVPGIVTVQDFFQENGTAYFVMEYVDGTSLAKAVAAAGGKLPYARAEALLKPVMEALEQVHAKKLLHRDISPDNILVDREGRSHLVDFGAARFALGGDHTMSVILKHGFAPEEQYRTHGNQGPWTDVYAMAATLYYCITGALPPDSIDRLHTDTLLLPAQMGVALPACANAAIGHALAVRAEDRCQSMGELLLELDGTAAAAKPAALGQTVALSPDKTAALQPAPEPAPEPAPSAQTAAGLQTVQQKLAALWAQLCADKKKMGLAVAAVCAVLALAVGVPVAVLSGGRHKVTTVEGSANSTLMQPGGNGAGGDTSQSIGGGQSTGSAQTGGTYTNAETGYSIDLPDGWTATEHGTTLMQAFDPTNTVEIVTLYTETGAENEALYGMQNFVLSARSVDNWLADFLGVKSAEVQSCTFNEDGSQAYLYITFENDGVWYQGRIMVFDPQKGAFGCYVGVMSVVTDNDQLDKLFEEGEKALFTMRQTGEVTTAKYVKGINQDGGYQFLFDNTLVQGGTETDDDGVGMIFYLNKDQDGAFVRIDYVPADTAESISDLFAQIAAAYREQISSDATYTEGEIVETGMGRNEGARTQDNTLEISGTTWNMRLTAFPMSAGGFWMITTMAPEEQTDTARELSDQITWSFCLLAS